MKCVVVFISMFFVTTVSSAANTTGDLIFQFEAADSDEEELTAFYNRPKTPSNGRQFNDSDDDGSVLELCSPISFLSVSDKEVDSGETTEDDLYGAENPMRPSTPPDNNLRGFFRLGEAEFLRLQQGQLNSDEQMARDLQENEDEELEALSS